VLNLKRFYQSGAGAVVLWVASSLVVAAVLAPHLYQLGMDLAAAAATRELPAALEWLGRKCARADFDRYFNRSLIISAVGLLPLLLRRMRGLKSAEGEAGKACASGSWQSAATQILVGCVIAGAMLWLMGMLLVEFGAYAPRSNPVRPDRLLVKAFVPAAVVALLEEWLFRGIVLTIWLRFARPFAACLGTSLLFAIVHFLKLPDNAVISNPASTLAGFELLGKVLLHFTNPQFFVTDFATLFFIGMILAWARVRTEALWFSIGLHAGWIMALKSFNMVFKGISGSALHPWGVGDSLRSGVFPLVTLGLTAVLCHVALRWFEPRRIRV
jgi:membrane protease YdiL (CAAX protease family)